MTVTPPRKGAAIAAAFVAFAAGAVVAALAIDDGSYDLVSRQGAAVLAWWLTGVLALAIPRGALKPGASAVVLTAFGVAIPLWIAIGLDASISTERTATEFARWVAHLAPLVLLGWVMPARQWRNVIAGVTAGSMLVVAIGFADRLSPGLVNSEAVVVFDNTTDRLATPLGYWNAVGSWAVISILLVLGASSHAARASVRALAMAGVPMAVGVAYVTYSRSAIASGVIALVVLLVLARNRWTLAVHTAAGALGGAAVVAAIRAQPEIADATGGAGGATVLAAAIAAGLAAAAAAFATGRLNLDGLRMAPRRGRVVGLAATAIAAFALAGMAAQRGSDVWDRFEQGAADQSGADRLTDIGNGPRVGQWRTAYEAWEAHPTSGQGAGTFELIWNRSPRTDGSFVRDAHSAFLEALAEQGTVGFLLLVGFVLAAAAVVIAARRRVREGADRGLVAGAGAGIAAFIVGSGFDWFWEVTALAALMLVLLGALMALTREHLEEPAVANRVDSSGADSAGAAGAGANSSGKDSAGTGDDVSDADAKPLTPRGRPVVWRVAVVAVAILGVLTQLPGLVGTSEVRRSQQAVAAGDLNQARSHADQAIETMPWASSPFLQRALVDEQAGAWDASQQALVLAMRRDPLDWRLPLVLARVEAKAGNPDAALEAYAKAKALRPKGEFFK